MRAWVEKMIEGMKVSSVVVALSVLMAVEIKETNLETPDLVLILSAKV